MKGTKIIIIALLLPFFFLASAEIKIITDIYPVYILVHDIIKGSPAEVKVIRETVDDIHDHGFGLKARDLNAIKGCHLLISYGIKKYKDSVCEGRCIDLSGNLKILKGVNTSDDDLHFWLSPENGIKIIDIIAQRLAKINEKNRQIYLDNAERIKNAINEEVNLIAGELQKMQPISGNYLVLHDAYQYFERFFGIKSPYGYLYDSNHNINSFSKIEDFKKKAQRKEIKCIIAASDNHNSNLRSFKKLMKVIYIDPLGHHIKKDFDNGYVRLLHSVFLGYRECLEK